MLLKAIAIAGALVNGVDMGLCVYTRQWDQAALSWVMAAIALRLYLYALDNPGRVTLDHRSLAMRLRYDLLREAHPAGTRLPSVKDYASLYGASRPTVMRAMRILADEDLVDIIPSRGLFAVGANGDKGARMIRPSVELEAHIRALVSATSPGDIVRMSASRLADQFRVSRTTVVRAQSKLVGEGLIGESATGYFYKR